MFALFHNAPVVDHKNHVRFPYGGQAVRDDKIGSAFHQGFHRLLNQHFRAGVNGAGRFIENQYCRVGQNRAGNGQQLTLPLGYVGAVFFEHGFDAVGQGADKVGHARRVSRCLDVFLARVLPAVGDVFPDGAFEQPGILQHHTEYFTQVFTRQLAYVDAVNHDTACLHIIKTHQQVNQCGFAPARGTDNRDELPGFNLYVHVFNERLVRQIAEVHMLDFNPALRGVNDAGAALRNFLFLLQQREDPFRAGEGRLQLVRDVAQRDNGLHEQHGVGVKRGDVAKRHAPADDINPAEYADDNERDISEKVKDGANQAGHKLGSSAHESELVVDIVKFFFGTGFPAENLHNFVPGKHFLNMAVEFARSVPLGFEVLFGTARDRDNHQ